MEPIAPAVDVVIAVHDPRRDISRSVGSVLTSASVSRVVVVCHNTPVEGIAQRLQSLARDPRVVLVPLADGVPSPAGPFNLGLELVDAPFVSIMGSDDELAAGAVDVWLAAALDHDAEMVIAPVRYAGGGRMPTPPTRPWRTGHLDGVRDRLAYRTAPLGLIARSRFGDLRMTEGLASGEDLLFSTRLWFSGASIAKVKGSAEYLVHDDAERVTFTRRPLVDDLAAVVGLLDDAWVGALGEGARAAVAAKLWRLPIFGAIHYRAGAWTEVDRVTLAEVGGRLTSYSASALRVLSRADRSLIDGLLDPRVPDTTLDGLSVARRRFLSPSALIPSAMSQIWAREAPLRFIAATWVAGRG